MDDSDDPLVCIHVLDTWVQVALSEALFELAKNFHSEMKPIKSAIDVFDDIMHCNVPGIDSDHPGTPATHYAPVATVDMSTTREEFVADAVLGRLGLDATSGPQLLGIRRWIAVRERYLEMFAHAIQSLGLCGASSDVSEIEQPNSRDGSAMDRHDGTSDEEFVWTARVAPAQPAVTQFIDEKPRRARKPPKSSSNRRPSSTELTESPQSKPSAGKTKARRCGEQLQLLRHDTKGLLGRKG